MRTVTYGAACSLDGFITARDGSIDWLHFSRDVQQVMTDYWKTVDTVLMGRKTWEFAGGRSGGGGGGGGMPGVSAYVFSRTLELSEHPKLRIISEDAGGFVNALKQQKGKDICVLGGGELARSLIEAGAVDEIGMNIHPILLGGGVPFLPGVREIVKLELLENRTLDGGCVLARYSVQR